MPISITCLTSHDITALRQLNRLFGAVFQDDAYVRSEPTDAYLGAFLASPEHVVLVARESGATDEPVIGGLVAYLISKFEQDRRELYVYDVAVAAGLQGRGIGRSLMEAIRREAGRIGAAVVFLQADEGDDAVEFYRHLDPAEDQATRTFDFRPLE